MSVTTDRQQAEDAAAVIRLGARIRQLRKARGLTLVQLATATELSHPFLSQLERGLAQPSLGSLRRIALALETSPIELIAAAEAPAAGAMDVEVQRAGTGAVPEGFAAGSARMLVHGDRPFHPMEVVSDAVEEGECFVHDEEEFLYVVEGSVFVELAGTAHALGAGDSIYYGGGISHRWWSADGTPYRLVVVKEGPRLRGR
ncbi:MAG: XRE family transcriptional regulator [Microbacterium sp.]|uniref:helix-turn-helix domain-containing protein n=1 Tax=Microbacterium sp. TaxID=51671 RepID=UPI0039E2826A